MVRPIEDIENDPMSVESIRKWAEEVMSFIFSRSQEFLVENRTGDSGFLMLSGRPGPEWEDNNIISFTYKAPYAVDIEFGTDPHPVSAKQLIKWVHTKLGLKDKKATGAAYAIAHKITREGTNPQPFIRPSINSAIVKYNLTIQPINIEE